MFGLEIIDIAVIVIYFVVVLYIGFRAMKHIHNQEDYFMGGRRFGKIVQFFAAFGAATSSDTAVGTTTTTYNNGAAGIWSSLLVLWATPIYWFTSPWYRRMRMLTLGDFFEERYGSKRMAGFYSIIATLFLIGIIAIGFKAVSTTVLGITQKDQAQFTQAERTEHNEALKLERLRQLKGENKLDAGQAQRLEQLEIRKPRKEFSHINENFLTWIICAIVFAYAIAGGLEAALHTNTMQGIFIIILSIILIPFGLIRINAMFGSTGILGAVSEVHRQLPESYFDIFGSAKTIDFTWYYIAAISLMVSINVAVEACVMNMAGGAKDELTARIGFTWGCLVKRVCIVMWGVTGLIAIALYSGTIENSDYVWGYATRDLLGGMNIGLVGLMIACLMAALMSTADVMMIAAAGILTHNLYRPLLPNFSERHYVTVGRIAGGIVLIGAVLLATWFDTILQMMKFLWEFNAILAAAFWCGIKWRRANRIGAWSSMCVALVLFGILPIVLPVLQPGLRTNSRLLKQTDPEVITRTYIAHQMDVVERDKEIEQWDKLNQQRKAEGPQPLAIVAGQEIKKVIQPPKKPIFWSKGIKEKEGVPEGDGLFYVELAVIDRVFDLSKNPYALNETIRTLIKVVLPFMVLIIISLLTRPDNKQLLDRFFSKMRTPVNPDRRIDQEEVEKSYADPNRFRDRLLFPNSAFEFGKWKKVDGIGFALAVLGVLGVVGILYLALHIGT